MKHSDHDRLLAAILADENVEHLRAKSLAGILTAVRSRRQRRAIVSWTAASLAVAMTLIALSHHESRPPTISVASAPAPPPTASRVKIINDEQLLALFPERGVALIGAPGAQRLMFLDHGNPPQ